MKTFPIFFLLIPLFFSQKSDNYGSPDTIPKDKFNFAKRMSLPGYNPTALINKPPNSIEYKSNNILPYGQINEIFSKNKEKNVYFPEKSDEKLRTSLVNFNEEKIFNQVFPEEFEKINWLPILPKNNVFISKKDKNKDENNDIGQDSTGSFANSPQTNYFYSSFPNYQPVPLPKIDNEPNLLKNLMKLRKK